MILTRPTTQAMLEALRASLWGEVPNPVFFENLSGQDWREVFQMSIHQTVEAMVATAVQQLPEQLLPPTEIMLKWLVRVDRVQRKNAAMEKAIAQQYHLFQQNGLRCVLQKGHGVSTYYADPSLRTSGDIDWFFPFKDDFEDAQHLVAGNQGSLLSKNRNSCGFYWQGFEVEQHRRIVQLRNPFIQSFVEDFVHEELKRPISRTFGHTSVEIPSNLLNIVQVNAHILKHQVTYGIGLRQLCDACRLYFSYGKRLDHDRLREVYAKLGMLKWAHLLHRMLVDLFHLPEEYLPFPIIPYKGAEWMTDHILRTGNFGFFDPLHPDQNNPGGRVDRQERLFENFRRFLGVAPMEALSFPIYQLYIKSFK